MSCIFCRQAQLAPIPLYQDESGASITLSPNGELTFTEGNEAVVELLASIVASNPHIKVPSLPQPVKHTILVDKCPICGANLNSIKANKEENYVPVCNSCGKVAERVDYMEIGKDSISTFDTTTCSCHGKHRAPERNKERSGKGMTEDKFRMLIEVKFKKLGNGYVWD